MKNEPSSNESPFKVGAEVRLRGIPAPLMTVRGVNPDGYRPDGAPKETMYLVRWVAAGVVRLANLAGSQLEAT